MFDFVNAYSIFPVHISEGFRQWNESLDYGDQTLVLEMYFAKFHGDKWFNRHKERECVYWAHYRGHPNPQRFGYVGTTNNFETRKSQHLSKSDNPSANPFITAIRDHADKIVWDILADGLTEFEAKVIEEIYGLSSNIAAADYLRK